MGYDNAGGYNRTRNFSADASAGIKILASAMDAELDDFASAMTLPLLRDGQNSPTADIPMGGYKLVNVGGPSSATNYMRPKDFIENIPIYMEDAETSTDRISVSAAYFTTASAGLAPVGGTRILIKMGSDKGSAPAIFLNTGDGSPYSANVVLNDGSALYSGAIRSAGIYDFIFSSAESTWHLMNPTFRVATETTPGLVEIATTAESDAGTDTTRAITPALLARKFSSDVATTASAGLIEIATTAEATAGTDASRAITPSTLEVVRRSVLHAHAIIAVTSTGSSVAFLGRSELASAWSASVSSQGVTIFHNLGLASANAAAVNLQVHANQLSSYSRHAALLGITTSYFNFNFINLTSASAGEVQFPVSARVHIQMMI